MTELNPDIDLGQLGRVEKKIPRPRRFRPIWLLPILVLIVFVILLWSTLMDYFQESREVSLIRPRVTQSVGRAEGTLLLQAAGWVEPNPFAQSVTALTAGVVSEMLVEETQAVEKGEVVARLVPDTRILELEAAEAQLKSARANLMLAEVEAKNAQESFDAALIVTEALEVAQAGLKGHIEECAANAAAVRMTEAKLAVARSELETQRYLASENAAGPWQLELATAKVNEIEADWQRSQRIHLQSEQLREMMKARVKRAEEDLKLRLVDRLRLENALANQELQTAKVSEAETKVALAKVEYDYCEVRAPLAGIVLERLAMPGSVVASGRQGAPVCSLYDPQSLRLRVDVPQADIAVIEVGQMAAIINNARPNQPYQGRVIRIVDRANIQKVTLEVHVEILDNDGLLRPEMLSQVRFLATGTGTTVGAETTQQALLIPHRVLVQQNKVWVVDARDPRAVLRELRLGARRGDDVEVLEGLNLSDKVIDEGRDDLEVGTRLSIKKEQP